MKRAPAVALIRWLALPAGVAANTGGALRGAPPRGLAPGDERAIMVARSVAGRGLEGQASMPPAIPTVQHQKRPGRGYRKGSPLYERQRLLSEEGRRPMPPEAMLDEYPETVWGCWKHYPLTLLLGNLVYVTLVLCTACLYRRVHPLDRANLYQASYRKEGDFGALMALPKSTQDLQIALLACTCPAVRWAGTMSGPRAALLGFWPALAALLSLSALGLAAWAAPLPLLALGPVHNRGPVPVLAVVLIVALVQGLGFWPALGLALFVYPALGPTAFIMAVVLLAAPALIGATFRHWLRRQLGHAPTARMLLNRDILAWCCCLPCVLTQEAWATENDAGADMGIFAPSRSGPYVPR